MIHPQLEHAGESAWPFARVARYACGTVVAPASALVFDADSADGVSGSGYWPAASAALISGVITPTSYASSGDM